MPPADAAVAAEEENDVEDMRKGAYLKFNFSSVLDMGHFCLDPALILFKSRDFLTAWPVCIYLS